MGEDAVLRSYCLTVTQAPGLGMPLTLIPAQTRPGCICLSYVCLKLRSVLQPFDSGDSRSSYNLLLTSKNRM